VNGASPTRKGHIGRVRFGVDGLGVERHGLGRTRGVKMRVSQRGRGISCYLGRATPSNEISPLGRG
jgi:hypothetical protein